MPKFKLVTGSHVKDTTLGVEESFYKAGDVVESTVDLEKAFGKEKFVAVEEESPEAKFKAMTVAQLKEFAAEQTVEVPDNTKKDDIIKLLLEKVVK
jgi:hypothetical protein